MPMVPEPQDLAGTGAAPEHLTWLQRYDLRVVRGGLPATWDGADPAPPSEADSRSQLWIRERPARVLDYPALAARCDVFFPRIWLRRARHMPAGTVTLTVYFHATTQQLQDCGDDFVLGQARGQGYGDGFFDQSAQIWSRAGALLATSHQLVYYKEN
jgi:acyl-CoA thioesterase